MQSWKHNKCINNKKLIQLIKKKVFSSQTVFSKYLNFILAKQSSTVIVEQIATEAL